MRILLVLLAGLGCADVNPDAPPDAGCPRPPSDWEVLVDDEAGDAGPGEELRPARCAEPRPSPRGDAG